MGDRRIQLQRRFLGWIDQLGHDGQVCLTWKYQNQWMKLSMRQGNEADYRIAGEMVKGGYEIPPFLPKSIVDGGANIGTFTIAAQLHFPTTPVICYEPDSQNLEQLHYNLSLNQSLKNQQPIKTLPLGLWSKNTTLYYHAQASHLGFVDEQPPGIAITCVLPEIGEDCWLKLDVEGAEHEVVPALLKQGSYPRWLSLEIHHVQQQGKALIQCLQDHGYRFTEEPDLNADCIVVTAYQPTPQVNKPHCQEGHNS